MHSMQCMWKMGKGWKHRVPLASNGMHDNKGEKTQTFKKIKEKWIKPFSPKDILPLLLFPRADHASSCMQPSSRGRYSCSVALLKRREFLLSPEVNVSTDPTHHLGIAVREPSPAFWVVLIAAKLGRASPFRVVSCSDGVGADFQQ